MMSHIFLKFILLCTLVNLCNSCPGNLTPVKFNQVFGNKWGEIVTSDDSTAVSLSLRKQTGSSGFASRNSYLSGLVSSYIKLPPQNYTGGVVVTFYTTNSDKYPENRHDEIDFEFLGHTDSDEWILQTNFFGNGSIGRGREERYTLWFDPSREAHKYSIFWDEDQILFYVDDILIREVQKVEGMGGDFPSKPMTLFATIWDGSSWATDEGKAKANFTLEPFVAEYSDITVDGCRFNSIKNLTFCGGAGHWTVCGRITTPQQLERYEEFRKEHLIYSYCDDKTRYNPPLPECLVQPRSMSSKI